MTLCGNKTLRLVCRCLRNKTFGRHVGTFERKMLNSWATTEHSLAGTEWVVTYISIVNVT